MARIAEDSDFESLKQLVFDMNGWGIEIDKSDTKVWSKPVDGCNFQMVKIHTILPDVTAETLYDVRTNYTKDNLIIIRMSDDEKVELYLIFLYGF